jgi:HJR/Mrr/RecB family endonuclease
MWVFNVLIGKRKGLTWGCKKRRKNEKCMVFMGCVYTTRELGTRKRREREKRTHEGASMLKTLNIFINQLLHSFGSGWKFMLITGSSKIKVRYKSKFL